MSDLHRKNDDFLKNIRTYTSFLGAYLAEHILRHFHKVSFHIAALLRSNDPETTGKLQESYIKHSFTQFNHCRLDEPCERLSNTQAKRAGKVRLELKSYVMQDYDVVNFRFTK